MNHNSRRNQTGRFPLTFAFLAFVGLAVLPGCKRTDPDGPSRDVITFAPSVTKTRALMDGVNLDSPNTRIKVYDYLSGFSGTLNGVTVTTTDETKYFDDEIRYNNTAAWAYDDANTEYPWTKTGTHTFFGWLTRDSLNTTMAVTPTYNESTRTLSIPSLTMTGLPAQQFDFSYSNKLSINAATRQVGEMVPLRLHHLFSALGISIKNSSGNTILLQQVGFSGLKNTHGATLDYQSGSPAVSYTGDGSEPFTVFSSANPDGTEFISSETAPATVLSDFFLMWPHDYEDLSGATITVTYKVRDINDVVSNSLTATIPLAAQDFLSSGLEADTKYTLILQFKKSSIDLYVRVLPWEQESFDLDYSNNSIAARSGGAASDHDGVLVFHHGQGDNLQEPTAEEWSAKTIRFASRSEVLTGRFFIAAPTTGRWMITAYPADVAQYFILEPTTGEIDLNADNTGMSVFTVRTNPAKVPTSIQTLYFSVSILLNGEWHDANSEFNRKNIKLILEPQ